MRRSTATAPRTTRSRPTITASPPAAAFCAAAPGNNISGCVGDSRGYRLDTIGGDVNNTSRFDVGDWRNAVTYGLDAFNDHVDDRRQPRQLEYHDAGRRAHGLRRLRAAEEQLFDLARGGQRGPLRPLRVELAGTNSTGGDRFSPKITVGVTPVAGFTPYVSYAEGYRAPSITETLIAGSHATGGGPAFRLPGRPRRPVLLPAQSEPAAGGRQEQGSRRQPEVRRHLHPADTFRGKLNVFRNDVDDYIDLVASPPVATLGSVPIQPVLPVSEHRAVPGSRASKPRRCMTRASGSSASPAT